MSKEVRKDVLYSMILFPRLNDEETLSEAVVYALNNGLYRATSRVTPALGPDVAEELQSMAKSLVGEHGLKSSVDLIINQADKYRNLEIINNSGLVNIAPDGAFTLMGDPTFNEAFQKFVNDRIYVLPGMLEDIVKMIKAYEKVLLARYEFIDAVSSHKFKA